ncbi:MAG: ester cyclase [Bacteroidota bacterium]
MKRYVIAGIAACSFFSALALAQAPVVAHANHETMLGSPDARSARNKKIVYDFWREVVEAGRTELIDKYVGENYIQHNPNLAVGRAAFAESIARNVKPQLVQPRVKSPLIAIVADGDLVVVALASEVQDAQDPSKKWTTTWFDMFRLDNGKIVEHWDPAPKLP